MHPLHFLCLASQMKNKTTNISEPSGLPGLGGGGRVYGGEKIKSGSCLLGGGGAYKGIPAYVFCMYPTRSIHNPCLGHMLQRPPALSQWGASVVNMWDASEGGWVT